METRISKSQFKAHSLEIFRRVERTGEAIIITDRGREALILSRYVPTDADPRQRLKGSVLRYDDPTEPVGTDSWDALA